MVFLINVTPINDICILSLHDALPISLDLDRFPELVNRDISRVVASLEAEINLPRVARIVFPDRKSTRLNSSHLGISYAVFCFDKKLPAKNLSNHQRERDLSKVTNNID